MLETLKHFYKIFIVGGKKTIKFVANALIDFDIMFFSLRYLVDYYTRLVNRVFGWGLSSGMT